MSALDQLNPEDIKNMRIQEILTKLFDPTDIVHVKNPSPTDYRWEQAGVDKRDEQGRISRVIDTYEVKAGETKALPASAAILYIDYMVKHLFGLQGKIGNVLQPVLVAEAIDKVLVGVNRGSDMLKDIRVSTVNERAGVSAYPPEQPAAPAPVTGDFSLDELGLDPNNIEQPTGADPDQVPVEQFAQPAVADQFPGLNNPTD